MHRRSWRETASQATCTRRHLSAGLAGPCRSDSRRRASCSTVSRICSMADLTTLPAREVIGLLRRREVSPLELIDASLARIEAVGARVNAVPTICAERARARARRLTDMAPPEQDRGCARRAAGADQGPGRGRGRSHHDGLADLRGPRPGFLGLAGGADRGCRRDRARQDQHARVRGRRQHVQRGVRGHPQSVGHGAHLRWLVRWLGGRLGNGHGLARRRLRSRRLAADPGRVLRRCRSAAFARPRSGRAQVAAVRHARRRGSDGPRRARRRALPRCAGGLRPARPAELRPAHAGLCDHGRAARAARAGRFHPRSRRHHAG